MLIGQPIIVFSDRHKDVWVLNFYITMHSVVNLLCVGKGERKMDRFKGEGTKDWSQGLRSKITCLLSLPGTIVMSWQIRVCQDCNNCGSNTSYSHLVGINRFSAPKIRLCINFFSAYIYKFAFFTCEQSLVVGF